MGLITAFFNFIKLRLEKSTEQLADWAASRIELGVKYLFWLITANFKRKYLKALFFKYRKYQTKGYNINTGLNLLDVYIPLRMTYESVEKIDPKILKELRDETKGNRIWNFISFKSRDYTNQHLAIVAAPGSGKTTLLEHITLVLSRNLQKQYHKKMPFYLPVLIYLKHIPRFISDGKLPSIEDVICGEDFIKEENPNPAWLRKILTTGKCLVMFDGLDEVGDRELRKKVAEWIDSNIEKYKSSRFIITSRPFGYKYNPIHNCFHY